MNRSEPPSSAESGDSAGLRDSGASNPPGTEFHCTVCGECCRGDQKVWLNPDDLERLVRHLGMCNTDELESQRIVVVEAGEHGASRPRMRFKSGPGGPFCRFLLNDLDDRGRLWGRCSLHDSGAKPLVCRLAPLARSVDLTDGSEIWMEVPPVTGCPGWTSNPPPSGGRSVTPPELDRVLRRDLDSETSFFRFLVRQMPKTG